MSSVLELLPHDMGLRVELDTNETYYLKSGWKERCDGIYGLACGYMDYAESITWFKDPARIAIMNSHVKLAVPWEEPETETTKQSEDTEMTCRRLPDAKGWYLTADHARLLRYDGYTWTAYTTDGDETELNDGYSTTADHDLLIRTLGAHRLPLTRLDLTAQHGWVLLDDKGGWTRCEPPKQ